jgi:type II secretory pathway pseudopilin PulG
MPTLRGRFARDDGESLIELTVAIMILGIVVVAIGACLAFTVKASGIHRNQALADLYLHDYAEAVQADYKPCTGSPPATASSYISDLMASPIGAPNGFATPTAAIAFWNSTPAAFATSASCPASDPGLQQLTLNLASNDGHVTESLVVVIRKSS